MELFQGAYACEKQLKKKFEYHERVLEELETESIEAQKHFINDVSDCLRSEEDNKKKTLKNVRKTLLAEECDTQARFEKLFGDLKDKLKSEAVQQMENLNDICAKLKTEINYYVETIFKLVTNHFRTLKNCENSNRKTRFWNEVDLEELKVTFRQHCEFFVDDMRDNILKELVNWAEQFTGMFQNNLIRHRKAVGKIIKAVAMLNVS